MNNTMLFPGDRSAPRTPAGWWWTAACTPPHCLDSCLECNNQYCFKLSRLDKYETDP